LCFALRRLDRFEITVVRRERSGLIMDLKSSINLVSKFSIFAGCWVLKKCCGGTLLVVAVASAYEYFNLVPGAGAAWPGVC
jgi:hypothetical protein